MITLSAAQFRDALPNGGRLIGLDVGTKTIGTALCDAGWSFASPALLIRRTKFQKDKAALAEIIKAQAAFAQNLKDMGLPILLQDERWSTVAVTRTLIEQDASRAKRAELVDKMAAAYILQGAIDALVTAQI
jgi:putative Holliday junction resolvase